MTLNRLSGLVSVFIGMILMFWIIPNQTETVDEGWLRPATLPMITAVIVMVAGLVQSIFPKGTVQFEWRPSTKALLYLVMGIGGLWLMHGIGFIMAAPVLMLALMLKVGERRWIWLFSGVVLLPALIWFCVDFLLKRPLP
jgi:putative tricarboxylic transport membrane protein